MKRPWIMTSLLAAICVLTTGMVAFADETTFVSGTYINDIAVSGLTVEEALGVIEAQYKETELTVTLVKQDEGLEVVSGNAGGVYQTIPVETLQAVLVEQNESGRVSGPGIINETEVATVVKYDETLLREEVTRVVAMTTSEAVITTEAAISEYVEGNPFYVIAAVQGGNLDTEKVIQAVAEAFVNGSAEVDLVTQNCYYEANVEGETQLQAVANLLNAYQQVVITYVAGTQTKTLGFSEFYPWITDIQGTTVTLDYEKLWAYINELSTTFSLNAESEVQALAIMLQSPKSRTREILVPGVSSQGTTFVEVDLTRQQVIMYKNGQVAWESPCVTGNLSKGYDTPPGVFYLSYKMKDKVLRGEKQADGSYEYESPVSFWMPFNGGIGFHDANWRSSFGGTIYETSGSHGCINLPPANTEALYNLVYDGIPVICHY